MIHVNNQMSKDDNWTKIRWIPRKKIPVMDRVKSRFHESGLGQGNYPQI